MAFHPLEKQENMYDGYRRVFQVDGLSLLLLQVDGTPRLIDNHCGHFGMPLDSGELTGNAIVCPEHGISFSLETGEIVNRPYENADPIGRYDIVVQDGNLGLDL